MSIPGAASPLFLGAAVAEEAAYQIDRSLRFNRADDSFLSKTPSSAGTRTTWTWSAWVKKASNGVYQGLFTSARSGFETLLMFDSSDRLHFYNWVSNAYGARKITTAVFRDPSAWYHIVFTWDSTNSTAANRAKLYVNGTQITDFGTSTDPGSSEDTTLNDAYAHRIGDYADNPNYNLSGYLADVYFIDGQALAPTNFGEYDSNNNWNPKAFSGTYGTNGFRLDFSDNSSDQALGYDAAVTQPTLNPRGGMDVVTYTGNGSTQTISGLAFQPDFVWFKAISGTAGVGNHRVFDVIRGSTKQLLPNLTNAEGTDSNTLTAFNSDGFTLGSSDGVNGSGTTYVAWAWKAGGPAELNEDGSIDSQVSVSTDYGFSIVTYTGDGSGTANSDSGDSFGHGLGVAPKLVICKRRNSANGWPVYHASTSLGALILNSTNALDTGSYLFAQQHPSSSVVYLGNNPEINATGSTYVAYCWSEVSGFSKFGSYSGTGNAVTVTTGFKPRYILVRSTSSGRDWLVWDAARGPSGGALQPNTSGTAYSDSTYNGISFNSDGFTIMTGGSTPNMSASGETYIYAAFADRPGNNWTTNNLIAEAGLETASQGMDVVTYTGNGSTQSISSLDFQPDLVWIKRRNSTNNHRIFDVIRGVNKSLSSDLTGTEYTPTNQLTAFNSDGFSLGSNNEVNENTGTYVAWCWKAGGTASSNTDGSITSSISANTTYGFSISTLTPSSGDFTVGHGLNTPPSLVIFKSRTQDPSNWFTYHRSAGPGGWLRLNGSNTITSNTTIWQNTDPSSSVVYASGASLGTTEHVMYCWSEVPGFSKFGSYTGNGSTTGPVVTLGFKPRFVMFKRTDASSSWRIHDTARHPSNPLDSLLFPNESSAETTNSAYNVDFLDDGFQIKNNNSNFNTSGGDYIYMAFASKPPGEIIDSLIDTPTNYEASSGNNGGNYCTGNPLNQSNSDILKDGNLHWDVDNTRVVTGTHAMSSGKWYWEATVDGIVNFLEIGIVGSEISFANQNNTAPGTYSSGFAYRSNATKINNNSATSYGASFVAGDVIGVAFDAGAGTLTFYKNGSTQGTAFTGIASAYYVPCVYGGSGAGNTGAFFNFGQRPFAYTPPTGHVSLCTTNLTDPTIADGSTAMDVALWTGDGSTSRDITGLEFSPDFVWIKQRSATRSSALFDTVRGANKRITSDSTNAETTQTNQLNAFLSNGFTIGDNNTVNVSSGTYVGWAWDGGTTTATNTDGSITSNVRANQSAGFSIVSFNISSTNVESSVGHGLSAAPTFYLIKNRSSADNWYAYTTAVDGTLDFRYLNSTDAFSASSRTLPTSSVFYFASSTTGDHIAYCFTPVAGYSAFGSYTGNGSSDGPFVYTGFRPKWLLIKNASNAYDWHLVDTSRDTYNAATKRLKPNSSAAEVDSVDVFDLLSNGFKLRSSDNNFNASSNNYIYACFSEHPFKTARAR